MPWALAISLVSGAIEDRPFARLAARSDRATNARRLLSSSGTPCPAGTYSTEAGATQNNCIVNPNALPALAWSKVPPPTSLVAGITGKGYAAGFSSGSSAALILGGETGQGVSAPLPPRLAFSGGSLQQLADVNGTGFYYNDRSATAAAPDGRLWAFGGLDASGKETQTLAVYSPSAPGGGWTVIAPVGGLAPPKRKSASMAFLSNCTSGSPYPYQCLLLFGGDFALSASAITRFNDVWIYFPATNSWMMPAAAQTSTTGANPPPTTQAAIAASVDGRAAFILGGSTAAGVVGDLFVLDTSGYFFPSPALGEMNNTALRAPAAIGPITAAYAPTGALFIPANAIAAGTPATTCSANLATDGNIPLGQLFDPTTSQCTFAVSYVNIATTSPFGQLSATGGSTNPWFYVDLGKTNSFDAIGIYSRSPSDMGPARFAGFQIWFGPSNAAPTLTAPPGAGANTLCANLPGDLTYQSNVVPCVGSGRYVWLYMPPAPTAGRYIVLSEFQVLQRQPWVWRKLSGYSNVAFLANAFASSVYFNGNQAGDPRYLTDGALSNAWPSQAGTTDRTTVPLPNCNNVHMTIDLGATYAVQGVALWPRTDCCRVRSKRIEIYVGGSRDWAFNTRVLSSADIENPAAGAGQGTYFPNSCPAATYGAAAQGTSCWGLALPAPVVGRYVSVRKVPYNSTNCAAVDPSASYQLQGTSAVSGAPSGSFSPAGQDANALNLGEMQVLAQRLTSQPAPRSNAAFTSVRGQLVVTGGIDAVGSLHQEVQMFDLASSSWSAPLTPIGTPPSPRTAATLLPLINASGAYNVPSTQLALSAGFDSTGNAIGDFNILTLPVCGPSPWLALPAGVYPGIASESCTSAGTVCSYVCAAGFVGAPANGPSNTIVCGPTGQWVGSLPVCVPQGASAIVGTAAINAPVAGTTSVVSLGFTGATVSWTAPASGIWAVTGFRVQSVRTDYVETFSSLDANGKQVLGFADANKWAAAPTDLLTDSTTYFLAATGELVVDNMGGAGSGAALGGAAAAAAPFLNLVQRRAFPAVLTGLNPAGDWAVETQLRVDMTTADQITNGMMAGVCIYDELYVRPWVGGVGSGACQMYAGLRYTGNVLQFGWESMLASTAGPSFSATGWSNWYTSQSAAAWVRIERRGLAGASAAALISQGLGGSWRVAFKFQAAGAWMYLPDVGVDSRLAPLNFPSGFTASSISLGLFARTWVNTVNQRMQGYFKYIRVGPVTPSPLPGSIRLLSNSSSPLGISGPQSATIAGLDAGQTYSFSVQAVAPAGFLSAATPVTGTISTPASSLLGAWASNANAYFASGKLVDAITATPGTKTTYQTSVWANNVAGCGPQLAIDGLADNGATGFVQGGNGNNGIWVPAGQTLAQCLATPSCAYPDRTLAATFTGASYANGGAGVTTGLLPSVDPLGDWWAIDLGIRTSVKALYISGRQNACCAQRVSNMEVWVGDSAPPFYNNSQRCDSSLMPVAALLNPAATVTDPYTKLRVPYSGFFQCTLPGRYVYLRAPGVGGTVSGFGFNALDGQLNFGEVRIYASNNCKARTGTNVVTSTPAACSGSAVTGGSLYGATCVHTCALGFTAQSGAGVANCDGAHSRTHARSRIALALLADPSRSLILTRLRRRQLGPAAARVLAGVHDPGVAGAAGWLPAGALLGQLLELALAAKLGLDQARGAAHRQRVVCARRRARGLDPPGLERPDGAALASSKDRRLRGRL